MPVWKVPDVEQEPDITLSDWAIGRVIEQDGSSIDILVGRTADGIGRISSAIKGFNPTRNYALTNSGRRYQLESPRGLRGNAVYMWDRVAASCKEMKDVTEEYYNNDT